MIFAPEHTHDHEVEDSDEEEPLVLTGYGSVLGIILENSQECLYEETS